MFCIYTQVSRVWIAGKADGYVRPGKTSGTLTICMPRQPETRTGKKPLHRKSTRNSRNTWLKTLSGAGAGVAGVAGGFCLYFVFEITAVRLKREQIQLVVDGDVVGTGVAARKGLLQGHLLEKSD